MPVNRRIATLLVALTPVLGLGVAGTAATVPYVALGPGPTYNTLDVVDGKQVVDIRGTPTHPTTGHLNMTTVSVRDGLTIFEAFGLWLSKDHGLVPRAEIYPPNRTRDQVDQANLADFKDSENNAQTAALTFLKYPMRTAVAGVALDGPAKDALRPGDRLVSVNGVAADSTKTVQDTVAAAKPGSPAVIVLDRDGAQRTVTVALGASPQDPAKGRLGVSLMPTPDVPFKIDFNLADVGGPSAGLMFSLAVIDKLTDDQLANGKFVAGTGTIDADGKVGPIGGIQYKMIAARDAGAVTFLVPADNCDEARQHTPAGLRLVRVDTLDTAVRSLDAIKDGGAAPSCG
jgi:PDZ domain-containing protein